jgi:cytohesin
MVDALIRLGADQNPVSSYGCTPLIEAVDYMDSAMAKRLADVGANVNYCSGEFGSALSCAAQRGSIDVARMLLDHEADPNVGKPLIVAFTTSADSMVPLLVERGADVNLRGTEGNTPLLMAVQFGSYDLVKYLLEHGAAQSINITDVRQHPLTTAVRKNLPEIVKLLLQYGADPNTVEMDENSSQYEYKSALIYSMEIGNAEIASQLIKSGANVSQYQGQYPLSYSLYLNQFDITKMLVLAGARPQEGELWDGSPLHQAVYQNAPDVVELMLNNGWDVNLGDHFDITPLWWTVQVSEQPDWPITDHSDMARLLIKYGADVNHKRDNGQPLINIAVESRAMWLVKILLDNGADPNITDAARDTPLHCAAKNGDLEMIECLLTRGASKLAVNKGGKTPKETAIANGHPEAAKLLE